MPHIRRNNSKHAGRALLVTLAAGGVLSACGTSSTPLTPTQAVNQSITDVGSQSGFSLNFSIGLTPAQLETLSTQNGGTAMPSATAQAISTGSIFFDVESGGSEAVNSKQYVKDKANKTDFGINVDGSAPVEFREVDQTFYVKADLSQLLSDVGESSAKVSSLSTELSTANQYVPGISALGQGSWVSVTAAAVAPLTSLFKQFESSQASSTGSTVPNSAQALGMFGKLAADAEGAFKANSTYVKNGTSNGSTQYTLTLSVQPFVQALGTALQSDLGSLPGYSDISGQITKASAKIPAGQTVTVQVFVKGKTLDEIDLDLKQFDPKLPFSVPIKMKIGAAPSITAPSGATALDLSKLPSLLSGLASGLGGLGAGSSGSTSTTTP